MGELALCLFVWPPKDPGQSHQRIVTPDPKCRASLAFSNSRLIPADMAKVETINRQGL